MPKRLGITIVEVLVSLGIVGLLMALILPAIADTRAASHRMSCASNLKQIMLACMNYESTNGVLTRALFHGPLLDDLGLSAAGDEVPLYRCPSDPEATGSLKSMRLSYFANMGLVSCQVLICG